MGKCIFSFQLCREWSVTQFCFFVPHRSRMEAKGPRANGAVPPQKILFRKKFSKCPHRFFARCPVFSGQRAKKHWKLRNDKINSFLLFGNRIKINEKSPLFGLRPLPPHRQFFFSPIRAPRQKHAFRIAPNKSVSTPCWKGAKSTLPLMGEKKNWRCVGVQTMGNFFALPFFCKRQGRKPERTPPVKSTPSLKKQIESLN